MPTTVATDPSTALFEKLSGIRVAMLTTTDEAGRLHSRPMATQETSADGALWFYTSTKAPAALNIQASPEVNLSYVDSSLQRYVSVAGRAWILHDTDRIQELWSPAVAAWFPLGLNDPNLTLIRVDVTEADYWDGGEGRFVRLSGFIRELLGEKPAATRDRGHLDLGTA